MATARVEEEPPADDSAGIMQGALTRLALIRDGSDHGKPFKRWRLASAEGHLAQSAILGAALSADGAMQHGAHDEIESPNTAANVAAGPIEPTAFDESAKL